MQGQKKRNAIIGYFQKRDSLTFLGDLDNLDARSTARRNSKEGTDLLSVLANPVNIRKTSAPPLNRQISLSSMKVLIRIFNSSIVPDNDGPNYCCSLLMTMTATAGPGAPGI